MSGANLRKFILYDANGNELELTSDSNVPTETKKTFFTQNPDGTERQVTTQNPLPVSDGLVCSNDIWVSESQMNNFSGVPTDLFDNLHSTLVDNTVNNPKEILIHFGTTVISSVIGIGSFAGAGGSFSNTEIQVATSDGVFITVVDESGDATLKNTEQYPLPTTAPFNAIKLRFHTANTITLTNLVIPTSKAVVARLQATKPDNTVADINATQGGNLKVSVEELESGISSNSNSQLNTTVFDQNGIPLNIDPTTGAVCQEAYAHCEIHEGNHFYRKAWIDIPGSGTIDILAVTPNTLKWGHMVVEFGFEAEANVTIYEGATTSADGTLLATHNRNRNSVITAGVLLYSGPTVTATGTDIGSYKTGSGRGTGGTARANNELVLKQNTKYLIRATNDVVTANWFDYLADWYEHTNN